MEHQYTNPANACETLGGSRDPAGRNQGNRLINEKSPYLLQHAHNPVDWYPWGEDAFAKARVEDKPVFLSIGYSTCHWCHVMERESFEDDDVARALNEGFVAIKVDREERPDIDHVYMEVCQSLTGSGGWPLTVFLTPGKQPFFAGTYFPKSSRYGHPGLLEVLASIRKQWLTDKQRLLDAGAEILRLLGPRLGAAQAGEPGPALLDQGYGLLAKNFDPEYGGFGSAPKFPSPHQLLFLLRSWKRTGEAQALKMVETTLQAMYCGGIYDHVGGGFSRYSTDRYWLAPHFEKMLYDNALLALAYLEACQATRNSFYGQVAGEVFTYVLRDMTAPEGCFYSAEDADSEGEEGRFYLWTLEQVRQVLGDEEGEFFCRHYDISEAGNFEGRSIPNLVHDRAALFGGGPGSKSPWDDERLLEARRRLFAARSSRIHPYKDDKVLTAWNGLMIAALARGAWVLGEEEYSQAAAKAANFLQRRLKDGSGRLLARYRDGQVAYPAYLDDYAFLAWGLLELYRATFDIRYLEQSLALTRQTGDLFHDQQNGGLFFTGRDSEQLPARPKEVYDGAMPSGNSVAALNLLRLARLTGDPALEGQAKEQLEAFAGTVSGYPAGYAFYLCALDFALSEPLEIVVAGQRGTVDTGALLQVLRQAFLPGATVLLKPPGEEGGQEPVSGRAAAYVCRNYACQAPVTDPQALARLLA
ncbi:MAG: thioredoxin domain-containing protein [Thermacetogeniaceae bacterium]